MKAKSSLIQSRSRDRRAEPLPRKPREAVFPISREEIVRRCREKPHDMLCAGEALALMDIMIRFHLTIKKLHELTHVARSMIHDILTLEAIEFHLLGHFTLRAEVSP